MSLQNILDERNISKYRLSQISGIPKTTIMDICSGKSSIENCSAKTVYSIAQSLEFSVEDLLNSPANILSLKDIRDRSKRVFDESDFVKKVFLFGSYARGEATDKSDLDFMVVLNREANLEFFGLYDLLQGVFGKKVDVIREEEAYRIMPKAIERDKVLIYERKN